MLSIIIPVYNTPPDYIERCLRSIRRDKYRDIEILLINDGSDDSRCVNYLEGCFPSDIRVFTQHRKGVSAARNLGIREAKGEYIAFVDADDEIADGFLCEASALAVQYDLDIIFGSVRHIPDTEHLGLQGADRFLILQGAELSEVKKSILEKRTAVFPRPILGSPCARLYRASICKKTGFNEDIRICEDQLFNLYALEKSSRVGIYPAYWYVYYQNPFSAMHNLNGCQDFYLYYKYLKQYALTYNNSEICKLVNIKLIGYMSGIAKQVLLSDSTICEKINNIKKVIQNSLLSETIHELKWNDPELGVWRRTEYIVWKIISILFKYQSR